MYKAIYVYTGAYDAILLSVPSDNGQGKFLMVDQETWTHFWEAEKNGDDFSAWDGPSLDLDEGGYDGEDWLWVMAEEMGDIVAYYDDVGKLIINDTRLYCLRKDFWER